LPEKMKSPGALGEVGTTRPSEDPTALVFTAITRSISAKARVTREKYGPLSP
jgi:hypothetical protein